MEPGSAIEAKEAREMQGEDLRNCLRISFGSARGEELFERCEKKGYVELAKVQALKKKKLKKLGFSKKEAMKVRGKKEKPKREKEEEDEERIDVEALFQVNDFGRVKARDININKYMIQWKEEVWLGKEGEEKLVEYCERLDEDLEEPIGVFVVEEAEVLQEESRRDGLKELMKKMQSKERQKVVARMLQMMEERAKEMRVAHEGWKVVRKLREIYGHLELDGYERGEELGKGFIGTKWVRMDVEWYNEERQKVASKNEQRLVLELGKRHDVELKDVWSNGAKRILLQGEPGAGKTTLQMLVAHEWALGQLWKERFDALVLVKLRARGMKEAVELKGLLQGLLNDKEREMFLRWCESNSERVLWVLDGWDEVDLEEGTILKKIADAADGAVQYLLGGTRPEGVKHVKTVEEGMDVKRNGILTIKGLCQEGQEEFVRKYFQGAGGETREKDKKNVEKALKEGWLREACRLPLMLRFVCMVAKDLDEAMSKTKIYELVVSEMLNRSGLRDEDAAKVRGALRKLAWEGFKRGRKQEVTSDTLVDVVLNFSDGGMAAKMKKSGLLKSEGRGGTNEMFSWMHFTIQEYLAAEHVCLGKEDVEDVGDLLAGIRMKMKGKSNVFFTFVTGIKKGRGREHIKKWYPPQVWEPLLDYGKLKSRGPIVWMEEGDEKVFEFLKKHWRSLLEVEGARNELLKIAAEEGCMQGVKFFCEGRCADDCQATDQDGRTTVHAAAERGHLDVLKYLVSKTVDVNVMDIHGRTPLDFAASRGHFESVQYLIANQANINAPDEFGWTPLFNAVANGHLKIVLELLTNGANYSAQTLEGRTPLFYAAENGFLQIVEYLLSVGAFADKLDVNKRTPLYLAAKKGHDDVVNCLLRHQACPCSEDWEGTSVLHNAAEGGHLRIIKRLLELGANICAKNRDGKTPLHVASSKGFIGVVCCLVEKGADVNCCEKYLETPLHGASEGGHLDVVMHLVANAADLNSRDSRDYTCLHRAAMRGHLKVVQYLLKKGSDLDARGFGDTPLHLAAKEGHFDVVELLVTQKASTISGALRLASFYGHVKIVNRLLETAQADDSDRIGLASALSEIISYVRFKKGNIVGLFASRTIEKHWTVVKCYVQQRELIDVLIDGRTLLIWAILARNPSMIAYLVDNGANVNIHDDSDIAPICYAAEQSQWEVVVLLVEKGANVNCSVPFEDSTPLHFAAREGSLKAVKSLIASGAETDLCDGRGWTPLRWALKGKHAEVAKYLKEARRERLSSLPHVSVK